MARVIYESGLTDLLVLIAKSGRVFVPSEKHPHSATGQFSFVEWSPGVSFAPGYPTTILPPTEFLLPQGEVLFSFESGKTTTPEKPNQIIFGLSLEDLEGIERLTKIMTTPIVDEPFNKTREATFIVGLDKYSPPTHLDYDLYLQEFEKGAYIGFAKTKQGKKWLDSKLFQNQIINSSNVVHFKDPILTDPDLSAAIKGSKDHPIWAELTKTCFGCGVCSYVCPLCYCFETEDKIDFGEESCGSRCRNWDSCMLQNFAATTHHNFRPELKDRIYNWYFHKFYRLPKEQGFVGCVDCNRCVIYCPAKINYRRVLTAVLTDYKKRPQK